MDDEDYITEVPYAIYTTTVSQMYDIYLSEAIVESRRYTDLYQLIRQASQYDIINIHINSNGGSLHTALELMKAMKESDARINTHLEGVAMSAAPIILFAGDDVFIGEHSIMMFHDFSTGVADKGTAIISTTTAYSELYKHLLEEYMYPFLSKAEIKDIIDGKDLNLNYPEINKRMKKLEKASDDES